MRNTKALLGFLVLLAVLLSGCNSVTPTPGAVMNDNTATPAAMMDTSTPDAMMATVTPGAMMDTATPEAMMDTSTPDTMMQATPTP